MPKRKREDNEDDPIGKIEDRAVRIKASRLQAKLEQSNKSLKDAVQLARGFERQKLSRRQKQAETQPHPLLRLREEVIVLKELDPTKTAKDYLFKQLVKTKRIRESPAFVALFGDEPEFSRPKSTAEGNVLGRLFKSNPVKEVLPDILKSIRNILGLEPGDSVKHGIESKHESHGIPSKTDSSRDDVTNSFSDPGDGSDIVNIRQRLLEGISLDEVSDSEDQVHNAPKFDDDGFTISDERSVDSAEESGSDSQTSITKTNHSRNNHSPASLSINSDVVDKTQKHTTNKTSDARKLDKTAFLPSLSMGGYYSGSESGSEDDFDPDKGSSNMQQRKNRRGQQARRAIAEKKYGQKAKHIANGKDRGPKGRRSGWDPRRGAVEERSGRIGFKRITGANGDAINAEKADKRRDMKTSDGALHPSWEAARKKKIENSTAAFAGKKITFD